MASVRACAIPLLPSGSFDGVIIVREPTMVSSGGNIPARLVRRTLTRAMLLLLSQGAGPSATWAMEDAAKQLMVQDRTQSNTQLAPGAAQQSPYAVEGLTLGMHLSSTSSAYKEYRCEPSLQFKEFTWCTKKRTGTERRGNFEATYSLLHGPDGTLVYVNRFQSPAYWDRNEVNDDIEHFSRRIGSKPNILQMPNRPGLPKGTIATWGKVSLRLLAPASIKALAENKPVREGILVDFIGDFSRSAREGLPVYRIMGNAGYIWIASDDETGRGTLRLSAVDASAFTRFDSPPSPQPPIAQQESLPQKKPEAPPTPMPAITTETLGKSQQARDALFNDLRATQTQYTFYYVVITLPPGTLPGVNIPVPFGAPHR
jgi:hypothetical protein